MKRTPFVLLVTLCAITLCAIAVVCMKKPIAGGYADAPVTHNDVIQVAEFAILTQSRTAHREATCRRKAIYRTAPSFEGARSTEEAHWIA